MKDLIVTEADRRACSVHLSGDGRSVAILDQTQLPNREVRLELRAAEEIYDAIKRLAVRGAPAIGICAGYAMYVLARQEKTEDFDTFLADTPVVSLLLFLLALLDNSLYLILLSFFLQAHFFEHFAVGLKDAFAYIKLVVIGRVLL